MIRINLLGGEKRLPAGLVNAVAAIGLLMVGFYWVKQISLADFLSDEDPEIVHLEEPVVHLDQQEQKDHALTAELEAELKRLPDTSKNAVTSEAKTARPAAPEKAVSQPGRSSGQERVRTPVDQGKKPADMALPKAQAVRQRPTKVVQPPPAQAVSIRRQRPHRSDACRHAIQLAANLPATIRFTSISSEMDGYFTLGGISQVEGIKILQGFSDSLSRGAIKANLSYWSAGKGEQPPYNFTINGQFAAGEQVNLSTLSPQSATKLLKRVAVWARQSGLDSLHVERPIRIPLVAKLTHHRHKIWALGSFDEIRSFIGALEADEDAAALRELAVSPIGPQHIDQPQARLYAALDLVVGGEEE
jgi:hypothetical protein